MQQTISQIEDHVKSTRSEKPVVKEGKLRDAWYAVSDAMIELSGCAKELKDEHFRHDVYMMMQKLDDTYDHLTKNYNWD